MNEMMLINLNLYMKVLYRLKQNLEADLEKVIHEANETVKFI